MPEPPAAPSVPVALAEEPPAAEDRTERALPVALALPLPEAAEARASGFQLSLSENTGE